VKSNVNLELEGLGQGIHEMTTMEWTWKWANSKKISHRAKIQWKGQGEKQEKHINKIQTQMEV